jgi:glycosyltransferase involved in cell wall biosynthesis
MEKPLVSIVLPVYNGSRYLEEAIDSCLAQTYTNWELIVVDDCSTDETPEIIARYVQADGRIRAVRHEQNRRLPGGLNTGFSLAGGDYLTWTSDDNCYRPEALAELVAFLEGLPEVDLAYADFSLMDSQGEWLMRVTVKNPEALAYTNCVGPCFLYRRRVREQVGDYSQEFSGVEDYDYWVRIALAFKLKPLHRDLYLYRSHGAALSFTQTERILSVSEQLRARYLPRLTWVSREARSEGYLRLAYLAALRKDKKMTGKYLLRGFLASPPRVFQRLSEFVRQLVSTQKPATPFGADHLEIREALRNSRMGRKTDWAQDITAQD